MNGGDVSQLRSDLRAEMRDGFSVLKEHIDARFDDSREERALMHGENLQQFRDVIAEQRKTNGRVTTLETVTRTLADEFQGIRRRWHDFRDSIQAKVTEAQAHKPATAETGENRHLTMRDVYVFVGGFSMFYAIGKLMKWIP